MADTRLMIVPCEYNDFPCSSFTCDQPHREKYWVGNPYSGGLHNYPIFCKSCITHLVSTLPTELMPGGSALQDRIRAELTVQYNELMASKLAEATDAIRQDADKYIAFKLADAEPSVTIATVEAEPEQALEDERINYRCLDCGKDFTTKDELDAHKITHASNQQPRERRKPPARERK